MNEKSRKIKPMKAGVKRRTSHEPNRMGFSHLHSIRLMRSAAFDLGLSSIYKLN